MRAFAIWLLSASLAAANPATDAALKAADDLRGAIAELDAAQTKADRVAALTTTITAYERGLAALRDGLRRAAIREQEIEKGFNAKRAQVGRLLGW